MARALQPSLVVASEARISVRTTVDLVAWYGSFSEPARARYWAADLSDFLEADWQRPVAYLDFLVTESCGDVDVPVERPAGWTGVNASAEGSVVQERNGVTPPHSDHHWTQDDFDVLTRWVRWISHATDGLAPETMNVPFVELEYLSA
jgi:hypothetical protein